MVNNTGLFRKIQSIKSLFLFYLLSGSLVFSSCRSQSPAAYVDPFICTEGDHGQWLPAALVPFGLVELCPDTWPGSLTADGDFAHSGYDFSDNHIRGFSHFHRGSSGGGSISDRAGEVSLLPFSVVPSDTFLVNPVLRIDKSGEYAKAGYYSVYMPDQEILAELTATTHSGFHRYTFNKTGQKKIFLSAGNGKGRRVIACRQLDNSSFEGSVGNKYFVIRFSVPVTRKEIWDGSKLSEGGDTGDQDTRGIVFGFDGLKQSTILVKVGVSLTSPEKAAMNLDSECPGWNFNRVRSEAYEKWNRQLSLVKVEGSDRDDKTIFYTALYHSCFLPVIQSDVDGTYRGLDLQLHRAMGYDHYDGFAFWDSFRTKYPLYSIWIPSVFSDITTSLRDIYEQADNWGPLPETDHPPHGVIFKAAGKTGYQGFASCRHEHMLMVVADAYFKGIMKINIDSVYPFMRKEVMLQMPEKYDSIGYIPARPDQTGEYSWDNGVLARVAKATGNESDYKYFMKRSEYWRNTWDPSIKFFRARAADGTWLDFPDDPSINREKYTYEGSKWQWRWNVIHDMPSLIENFGGKKNFVNELEYFFDHDHYTAGNQIDLQAPFLFNTAGAPWLTQKWVRKILTEPIVQKYGTHNFFASPVFDRVYKATPDGFLEEMDDDYGCMSAWYAMSAMGLYQVCTGDPVYQLTAPIFDKVTINLDRTFYKGSKFIIRTVNLSRENIYIQSATLNHKPYNKSEISHEDLVKGGELIYIMGPEPNKNWGI